MGTSHSSRKHECNRNLNTKPSSIGSNHVAIKKSLAKPQPASKISPPTCLRTKDEFGRLWFSWKEQFLNFIKSQDQSNAKQKWVDYLLNYLGPVGHEIWMTLVFIRPSEKEDIDVVLRKFDIYCAFGTRKKQPRENTYQYINELKTIAERYFSNIEEIVRSKIIDELHEHCIKNNDTARQTLLSNLNFEKLTLKETAYWWQFHENDFLNKQKYQGTDMIIDCDNCGADHIRNACPSKGKQCLKCQKFDHYHKRCPTIFVTNCSYCGGKHFVRKCPAYNETCTKCNKKNHFSWKCTGGSILCRFCGETHVASRSVCPALRNVCTNCSEKGHFAFKCNKKR